MRGDRLRFGEKRLHIRRGHRSERAKGAQRLVEYLHAIAAGDDDGRRKVQRVVETFDRRHRARLENDSVGHALHAEHADFLLHQLGEHELLEATIVRIHDVERHLNGVEGEAVVLRHL